MSTSTAPGHARGGKEDFGSFTAVKVAEILKVIKADGWVLSRTRGSHRQFTHPTRRGVVTVSGKPSDDLHPKTRDSILRQAGLRNGASAADDAPREDEP